MQNLQRSNLMGIRGSKDRALGQLSYRYWCKDKNRSSEENWKLANILLDKLVKRYSRS